MSWQPAKDPECKQRPDERLVIEPRARDIGAFDVRRVLPARERRSVGPFVFFDHIGPAEMGPGEGLDVRPHPHIGLATVTYLFEGEILHRDSLGEVQTIRPGAVNWMVAGRGIAHSERSPDDQRAAASRVHGIQSWVALPLEHEETEPSFVHHPADTLPVLEHATCELRLIAGSAYGKQAPARALSPMFYVDAQVEAGSSLELPTEHEERAVYVVSGTLEIDGEPCDEGRMVVFEPGCTPLLHARVPVRAMLLGGAPVGERFIWWNFVSSSRERIEQAKAAWRGDEFANVPGESERMPLPDK